MNSIKEVASLEFLSQKFLKTKLPDGKEVYLFPPAIETEFLKDKGYCLPLAPRLGEHNEKIIPKSEHKKKKNVTLNT